ncbi:FAD-binding protein [Amycolatopsis pigmentata]|uniref:FAD-binding protein n=1 Tax=Amycolatopsis pigmentata TaxID=450801 RepID=A0ABW5G0A5_9PSEU
MDDGLFSLSFDGEMRADSGALTQAAEDFGHVVADRPRAVLRPGSAADIATVLRFASEQGIPVVPRGQGHSTYGQAQARDGIVIDMSALDRVSHPSEDHVIVEAGATWADVLRTTLRQGLTPPVLTDYLGLSVGGTLSVGGLGGTSHRYGAQTDTVLALDAVTADGRTRSCSPTESPELFRSLLAGLGQCGVITRATLRLVPAPARVRRYKLFYRDIDLLTASQRVLMREGRFDHLQGQILPGPQGFRFMLDAATYYTPPAAPDDRELTADAGHEPGSEEIEDLSYWDFADRLSDGEAELRRLGAWTHPHPWANLLLPNTTTDDFLARILTGLTPDDLGAAGLVLVYPLLTRRLATPLLRTPAETITFLVAALRFPPPDPATVRRMIADNRSWYEQARELGGVSYPIGTIPFTGDDWRHHHGAGHPAFLELVDRFDPARILGSGLVRES